MSDSSNTLAADVEAFADYFRFTPNPEFSSSAGVVFTPLMGECAAGRVYKVVNPQTAEVLAGHPEWQRANRIQFDAQSKADQKEQANEE